MKLPPRIDALGVLQIAAMVSIAVVIINLAIVFWHYTDDYFTPISNYLLSFKLAFPPLAILLGSYALAFVTGTKVTEIPHAFASALRNRFFQSKTQMYVAIALAATLTVTVALLNSYHTPPAYGELVRELLGGQSDEFKIAAEKVDAIKRSNSDFADQLRKVMEVFKYRAAVNSGSETIATPKARVFVRSLEANVSDSWEQHPLRWHGLAESYLLYAQSVQKSIQATSATEPSKRRVPSSAVLFNKAIELYSKVADSNSSLVSRELRSSALNNLGNAYYYNKQNSKALTAWRRANAEEYGGTRSTTSWGNIVAGLVLLGKHRDAVEEGEKARAWAEQTGKAFIETYPYSGILENTGLARLQIGDFSGAVADLETANAFREDSLTRQNFAIVLILNRQFDEGRRVLRQVAPPANPSTQANLVAKESIAHCVYLIWALALEGATESEIAANYLAFLGEAHSADEISRVDVNTLKNIRRRAAERLPNAAYPCGSLSEIPRFLAAVTGEP